MRANGIRGLVAAVAATAMATGASAATISVPAGQSVQDAIGRARDGDTIVLADGTYDGDIDFLGKAVLVVGRGPKTILRGTGGGPVVTFASGETPASILDSVTVTGGRADTGGGVLVLGSSPTVVRTVVTGNRAGLRGSGIYIEAGSPLIYNNLLSYNAADGGDPHSLQMRDASPWVVNNTIVRGDSNGVLIAGASAPIVANNIIAFNGSAAGASRRGRGICDFSGGAAVIRHNIFHRNRIAALLRDGRDWRQIRQFQRRSDDPNVTDNTDGYPGFVGPPREDPEKTRHQDFFIRPWGARAAEQGNPDPGCNDLDGSPNTLGFTGGPFAPGSSAIPDPAVCGAR
jgi:hypothetical protein